MRTHKKRIVISLLVIMIVSGGVMAAQKFKKAYKHRHAGDVYAPLIPYMNLNETDPFEIRMDKIRRFVHGNSIHSIDNEFYKIDGDDKAIAALFMDRIEGRSKTGPHLECSSRSGVVQKIVRHMGYEVRGIVGYKYEDGYRSHVFVEIKNPETGKWIIQDPDYDVSWRIVSTGERASIDDLIKNDFDTYEPCVTPDRCGWVITNDLGKSPDNIKRSLAMALITERDKNGNSSKSSIVNTKRFDLSKAPDGAKNDKPFCEAVKKHCPADMVKY